MTHLIDKDALVAEIEELDEFYHFYKSASGLGFIESLLSFINSLEVKEINFEKEVKLWIDENTCNGYCSASIYDTAEHFFELGMQTKEGNTLAKAKGFLVRDKDDYTAIYSTKPERGKTEWVDGNHPRNANESSCLFTMDARLLPNVEFDDEPIEVEITIAKKGE